MSNVHEQLLSVLKRLLQAKARKPGTVVRVSQQTHVMICQIVKEVIANEPFLVQIAPPVRVVGDIHGQYYDLLRIFEEVGHPPDQQFLFLGDYVDRGPQNIETIALLLIYKILYPKHVFLLRGNHETSDVNALHGFKSECVSRYSRRLWTIFNEVFDVLPIGGKIFACHGGISPDITGLQFFDSVQRPLNPVAGPLADLIWSDPDPFGDGWHPNPRGQSFCYGPEQTHKFLDALGFELLVKAHQMVPGGFGFPFEPDRCVLTIFSGPCGGELENNGAVLAVNEAFECSFIIIKPMKRRIPGSRPALTRLDEILSMKNSMSRSLPNRPW
jgi:serine/threonine-protein phosphatase PP1 catalytic subunit